MEKKVAKKSSKYHNVGDEFLVNSTLDGDKFVALLKEKVVPTIIRKVGCFAEKVIIQMDSAGGHGVATNLPALNAWGRTQQWIPSDLIRTRSGRTIRSVPIEFVTQPTRSPDLNVLDLGAWASLQTAVEEVKYKSTGATEKLHERLHKAVLKAWDEWAGETVIYSLFQTLLAVNKRIVECRGGNEFNIHDQTRSKIKNGV